MQESNRVSIRTLDIDMASVISKNSVDNLRAFANRFEICEVEAIEKDVLALILKETILEHPEYILYIYSREALALLMDLWESEEMVLSQTDWALVGQLQLLGFLDYSFHSDKPQEGIIYLVKEAKDNFYFFLKTRQAAQKMEKFDIWERVIRGMMTFYGIISFNRLYFYFCKCMQEPVDDEELHTFLSIRISLGSFGCLVVESTSGLEYYESFDVKVPAKILDLCEQDQDRDYKKLNKEELLYVADNNGFGLWDGLSELADVLMDCLYVDYYQAVVILKSTVLMVQNGEDTGHVVDGVISWCPGGEIYRTEIFWGVREIYNSVPIYSLKGWSRAEKKGEVQPRPLFTVLEGGKKKSPKPNHKNNWPR